MSNVQKFKFDDNDEYEDWSIGVGVATGDPDDEFVPVDYEPDPDSPLIQSGTVAATGEPAYHRQNSRPVAGHWALWFPHQCDDWIVAEGPLEAALAKAKRFRDALDSAIAVMEAAE